jgi:hypothetical protein
VVAFFEVVLKHPQRKSALLVKEQRTHDTARHLPEKGSERRLPQKRGSSRREVRGKVNNVDPPPPVNELSR